MAVNLQYYSDIADAAVGQLTKSRENWTAYLKTAARLYKYPFHEQAMIFAQRPDAAAVATAEIWKNPMNRYIKYGSKGIALIKENAGKSSVSYVFDLADTADRRENAPRPQFWQFKPEHEAALLEHFAENYGVTDGGAAANIITIARELADEYYDDNAYDINSSVGGSFLEDYGGDNIRAAFTEALSLSASYSVLSRCGMNADHYFSGEDFNCIFDFNTLETTSALGTAAGELAGRLLREIERTVKNYEKNIQKGLANDNVHENRGLSNPRNTPAEAGGNTRQIRSDEAELSQAVPQDNLQYASAEAGASRSSDGNRPGGEQPVGADNDGFDGGKSASGQIGEPSGMDGAYEQSESAGGGNNPAGIDLQLENHNSDWEEYVSLYVMNNQSVLNAAANSDRENTLTEIENAVRQAKTDLKNIYINARNGSSANETDHYFTAEKITALAEKLYNIIAPEQSAPEIFDAQTDELLSDNLTESGISPEILDEILRDGGNDNNSILRIAAYFSLGKTPAENADFLKYEYLNGQYGRENKAGGKGFQFGNQQISVWFDESGMTLGYGKSAVFAVNSARITWEQAAARVHELSADGHYVSRDTFDEALENEKHETAQQLLYFYRDGEMDMPEEWKISPGGFPAQLEIVKNLLGSPDERQTILERLERDIVKWENSPDRPVWQNPDRLLVKMRDFMLPHDIFPGGSFIRKEEFTRYITEDEVDIYLTGGSIVSESKFRILSHFLHEHTLKAGAGLLKDEYGHGGGTWFGVHEGWHEAEPGKGITLKRGDIYTPYDIVNLSWTAAARRVDALIKDGRYLTAEELRRIPEYEKITLMRRVNDFYHGLPDEYAPPFAGLELHYPRGEDWEAVNDFLNDGEKISGALAVMEHIYNNTPQNDRFI